ncbi:hypothetical protein SH1V18_41060 [Vallitalea longa]|uniref:Uncharacterized protein n=1 Tax=Vallitalea longa TaxID=2936439 RepID=A0A9W5YFB3_9FIRM|nr:hypothetical protein SH1V18_41060 [Vallitalea longa]
MKTTNDDYRIFYNKNFWIIITSISFFIQLIFIVMNMILGNDILILQTLYMFFCLIFGILVVTFIICCIRFLIHDFKDSNIKNKLFIIILLILFSLKALMEISR